MRAVVPALVALLLAAPALGQSMSEAAQKERERRAKANDPKLSPAPAASGAATPRPAPTTEPDRRVLENVPPGWLR